MEVEKGQDPKFTVNFTAWKMDKEYQAKKKFRVSIKTPIRVVSRSARRFKQMEITLKRLTDWMFEYRNEHFDNISRILEPGRASLLKRARLSILSDFKCSDVTRRIADFAPDGPDIVSQMAALFTNELKGWINSLTQDEAITLWYHSLLLSGECIVEEEAAHVLSLLLEREITVSQVKKWVRGGILVECKNHPKGLSRIDTIELGKVVPLLKGRPQW